MPRAAKLSPHLSAAAPSAASLKRGARPQINCPPCSNPHSARGTLLASPTRFPPLEVFGRRPQRSRHHLHAAGIRKPCMGRLLSSLIFDPFPSPCSTSARSSPRPDPAFPGPRAQWRSRVAEWPSRSDLPLTVTSTAAGYVGWASARMTTIPRGARD